ncbi:hypothetical protein [Streptomyces sp. TR02-1]|uniref:hypothetical protein n=1 Tax=Streptomyces sp. TR02-1 TaxID=3385977 RepID=UPI0039A19FF1
MIEVLPVRGRGHLEGDTVLLVVRGAHHPEVKAPMLDQVLPTGTVVRLVGVRYLISSVEVDLGGVDSAQAAVYYRARVLADAELGSPDF